MEPQKARKVKQEQTKTVSKGSAPDQNNNKASQALCPPFQYQKAM